MTPNFALSLSFDGIRLLQRASTGWHLVGEVALDTPDLTAALADLRARAATLDTAPLRTKLLIPNDQIRYVTIETAQTTLDDVHAALDGATPYGIDELAIDFDRNGGRTFIAAVARETLEEAEAFATEHDFAPVCFAAIAEPFTFQAEVFFGPTKAARDLLAAGDAVDRDSEPVKVTGTVPAPEPEPEPEPEPAPTPKAEPVAPLAADEPTHDVALDDFGTAAEVPDETPADPAPEVVFASRSRGTSLPPQDMPAAEPAPEPVAATDAPAADTAEVKSDTVAADDAPLFTRRRDPPALAVPTGVAPGPAIGKPEPTLAPVSKPVTTDVPPPKTAPPLTGLPENAGDSFASIRATPADALAVDDPVTDPAPLPEPVAPPTKPAPVAERVAEPADEAEEMTVFGARDARRGKPRFLALKLTAALLLFLFLVALWANTLSDEGIAGWFGGSDDSTDQPTEVALAAPDPDTDLEPVPETAAASLPEPQVAVVATPAPSALTPEIDEPAPQAEAATPLPIVRAPSGRILTPAEADRIYAATGVWQRAPRFAVEPRAATLDEFVTYAALPSAERIDELTLPDPDLMQRDLPLGEQRNPPPAGTIYQRDLRGFILATPEGTLTPDGALVFAGPADSRPRARPGTPAVEPSAEPAPPVAANGEGLILVAGPPPRVPPLRPEGLVPETSTDTPEEAEASDPANLTDIAAGTSDPDTTPDADIAAALAAAQDVVTPTDSLPEGLNLIAGRPARVPPLRPEGLEATETPDVASVIVNPTDLTTVGGVSLASFKPATRPQGLVPDEPASLLNADPTLAGYRPATRPADILAGRNLEPEGPDLSSVVAAIAEAAPPSAFANVTPRAVALSTRPDTRPRNFDRVVAAARSRVARAQPQQQTASAPATTASRPAAAVSNTPARPTGPVPGSVARAATIDNAIRLRDMNLIGVYGRPGSRRALIRMGNGQYVKVTVGSSLDGGRVTAIGDSALNYVKRGRTYALQLPTG